MQGLREIAVVGSGVAGLGAAWLLSQRHNVVLFEREARAGGHSNTVDAPGLSGRPTPASRPVDTGFIVYNTHSYPNLVALFDHLGVATEPTSMSFAVSLDQGSYEYSGSGLAGLFGQPVNVFRPDHWRMIRDMLRFFREARSLLSAAPGESPALGDYLQANGYSEAFVQGHILPMAAAIWSTPVADVMAFPATAFVRFLDNHGLLQAQARADWRTVTGGSRQYVERLRAAMPATVRLADPVTGIVRTSDGVDVIHGGGRDRFDACVIATHADEAVNLLADADADEQRWLGAFRYTANRAVLHRDASFMPRRRRVWSSWNYLGAGHRGSHTPASDQLSLTYWMNNLQPHLARSGPGDDLFVTLSPQRPIPPDKLIAAFDYTHPLFDLAALQAQGRLWSLQGRRRTWFCGSYFGYGFHEDALQAGLAVAEDIGGVRRPWQVAGESGRIRISPPDTTRIGQAGHDTAGDTAREAAE